MPRQTRSIRQLVAVFLFQLFKMTSTNNKTSTNLAQYPQIAATLFEPIAPDTYDLGSSQFKWAEVHAHKVTKKGLPLVSLIPCAYSGTTPPATLALNGNLEFFVEAISSTAFSVYKYRNATDPPTLVDLPANSFLVYTLRSNVGLSYIAYRDPTLNWRRYLLSNS